VEHTHDPLGIQSQLCTGYQAIPLLNFEHMQSRSNNNTPFLVGLGIEPQNPWTTGMHRRRLRGKSGLFTLELCAGAGGQAIGLERAGIDHVGLVEINEKACSTLRHNRPKWNVIEHDLNTFDALRRYGYCLRRPALPTLLSGWKTAWHLGRTQSFSFADPSGGSGTSPCRHG
jgi:hypothetical protein